MNMKTLTAFAIVALSGIACFAAPHPVPRSIHRPHNHYGPRVHHHHYHPGPVFVGGVVGSLLGAAVIEATRPVFVASPAPRPTVIIQSPTIAPRQVWVEGRYQQQVVNGTIVNIWVPGHWETIYR